MPKMPKSPTSLPPCQLPAQCSVCGKIVTRRNLKSHMTTRHTDGGRLQCPHCTYSTPISRTWDLNTHITAKHTKEFPYPCPDCPEGFRNPRFLSLHRQKHHGYMPRTVRNNHSWRPVVAQNLSERTVTSPSVSDSFSSSSPSPDFRLENKEADSITSLSRSSSPGPSESDSFSSPIQISQMTIQYILNPTS